MEHGNKKDKNHYEGEIQLDKKILNFQNDSLDNNNDINVLKSNNRNLNSITNIKLSKSNSNDKSNYDNSKINLSNDSYLKNLNSKDEINISCSNKNKFIKEYTSDVNLYGLSIQNNSNTMRLAVSSLEVPYSNNEISNHENNTNLNKIEIIEYHSERDQLIKTCSIPTLFPQSKLLFCPSTSNNNLLASTSDILRIYKTNSVSSFSSNNENNKISLACELTKKSKKNSGPITSMDWNRVNSNLLGVSSIDTTCTIWDLQKQDVKTHLIAHDSEVFDINFGSNEHTFISTGADGSIRLFDLRALDTCSVLFESQDQTPLTRVSWNLCDNNYIASSTQDKNYIFIIDIRVLNTPIAYLTYHTNIINAMAWAPSSYSHICSVGDDKTALIWDIQMIENRTEDPILCYKSEKEVNNCLWAEPYEDWIAINSGNVLKMLKVI